MDKQEEVRDLVNAFSGVKQQAEKPPTAISAIQKQEIKAEKVDKKKVTAETVEPANAKERDLLQEEIAKLYDKIKDTKDKLKEKKNEISGKRLINIADAGRLLIELQEKCKGGSGSKNFDTFERRYKKIGFSETTVGNYRKLFKFSLANKTKFESWVREGISGSICYKMVDNLNAGKAETEGLDKKPVMKSEHRIVSVCDCNFALKVGPELQNADQIVGFVNDFLAKSGFQDKFKKFMGK